mmetsp:Transcript_48316/g.102758  ORF Transcript_48316/g.102758 Transcript_48316/m.102758 type:complete len:643 (+) Transcript_48316:534-2462(+)|eukprot:CAMPEP_0172537294 /NCGR_PEP_ID=MMETSP1067-20121228/8925_1 /TAXON_ID=265564 ORGANISM="Thalassiosira punctigera, Strain Tpunct2005C2" /NCGR_SAMPLE_ID=MMETSP1067 /ASSEMBLY_ACC=CAM_ASM_000444 /LENGTH=642 /DNA_ID=CAMNT_0013322567 /DNA_START=485 /DNA_END=2413 /DNA_ORIENTATION=-
MSLKSPLSLANPADISSFPRELHLDVLTFLRATDLSALQRTCRAFNDRELVAAVVDHYANEVYPSDLTKGFDTPIVSGEVRSVAVAAKKGSRKNGNNVQTTTPAATAGSTPTEKVYTYEMLRNMEMLVVARVLSRPEPPVHTRDSCFYVSKSWCRAALRWLEVQEEERKEREERRRVAEETKLAAAAAASDAAATPRGKGKKHNRKSHPGSSGKKKLSKKEQRQRDRKMSDAMPPWSNINTDIVCEHGSVKQCSTKSARARRRVMDKQAWKVLKCLYPDSVQLEAGNGCLMCAAEAETAKKAENDRKEEEKADRRKPLSCPLVRGFYTRGSKGYPLDCLVPPKSMPLDVTSSSNGGMLTPLYSGSAGCPLVPGVYCALPRSWCHQWRKYIKTGEGGMPPAPDASEVLCEAHNLPLVPPHLESFLRGETSTLLGGANAVAAAGIGGTDGEENVGRAPPVGAAFPGAGDRLGHGPPRGISATDAETLQALRAAGMSEVELHAQRVAMAGMERDFEHVSINDAPQGRARSGSLGWQGQPQQQQQRPVVVTNEQLDRENRVVVEILTDEEASALERWWPRCHGGTYALRFAVVADVRGGGGGGSSSSSNSEVLWNTAPCRECDPSSRSMTAGRFVVRNRLQQKRNR